MPLQVITQTDRFPLIPRLIPLAGLQMGILEDFYIEYAQAYFLGPVNSYTAIFHFIDCPKALPKFLININLLSIDRVNTAIIVAHEIIHLHQYMRGDLLCTPNPEVLIWKGEEIDLNRVEYRSRPWEVEAYRDQFKYARKLLEATKPR